MKKLYWIETEKRLTLSARVKVTSGDEEQFFVTGLNEQTMDPIQKWCREHNCGVRTSFDTFQFKNKKEITMFLLKWG